MKNSQIFVTKPKLPELDEFLPYLQSIWQSGNITNSGPFHQELELKLSEFLGVKHLSLFCNATIALVTALQALRVTGEVITTPYSFVATAHSLLWNGIKPVFVDIENTSLNIDTTKIESAITPQTTAIMPVHCYGHPCNVDEIEKIASNYNLKVIYDAAHAFGVDCHCGSLLNHGDLSVLSFHATKVFNTFEGGAIICNDAKTKQRIDHLKNFGFVNETTVVAAGINGKMSEFNAALGLLQLKEIDSAIDERKKISMKYIDKLSNIKGISFLPIKKEVKYNYAYFPILVKKQFKISRDELYEQLKANGIFTRRYFYPLISEFPMYRGLPSALPNNLPVATQASREVLCLPLYPGLTQEEQDFIIESIIHC